MLLIFVAVESISAYSSKADESRDIDTWERQALQATDPDVDFLGYKPTAAPTVADLRAGQAGNIRAWESNALRVTDPDSDAMDVLSSKAGLESRDSRRLSNILDADERVNIERPESTTGTKLSSNLKRPKRLDIVRSGRHESDGSKSHSSAKAESAKQLVTKPIVTLPEQIQKVRKFLLSLQRQVHRDAKESASALADFYRVDQNQRGQSEPHHTPLVSKSSTNPSVFGEIVNRFLMIFSNDCMCVHAKHSCAENKRASPKPNIQAHDDDDSPIAVLAAAEAADARARRLVAR